LRGEHHALHVKLVASREARVKWILEEGRAGRPTAKEAEQAMLDTDANRARYLKQYYGLDWSDPANYHMVLNTGLLGLDGAAAVVIERARGMWPEAQR
jgi:cytidylate kinase